MDEIQSQTLILDVRERLARIEVKIDNTNETLKSHDRRITENSDDIETLKTEVVAYKAKLATYAKIGAAIAAMGSLASWFFDHAHAVAVVASAVPN